MQDQTSLAVHAIRWAAISFIALVASCSAHDVATRAIYAGSINEATRAGRDPMTVGCAYGFSETGEAAVCAMNQSKQH